jgi:hypothetical protein
VQVVQGVVDGLPEEPVEGRQPEQQRQEMETVRQVMIDWRQVWSLRSMTELPTQRSHPVWQDQSSEATDGGEEESEKHHQWNLSYP